jgi:hypothetical protein
VSAIGSSVVGTEFRAEVPQAELDELQRRLDAARWPDQLPAAGAALEVPELVVEDLRNFFAKL